MATGNGRGWEGTLLTAALSSPMKDSLCSLDVFRRKSKKVILLENSVALFTDKN